MPPNMQQLLQELSQAQAVGVPLPASPAPPATGGGGARGLSLRVEQGLLAPPSAEEQEAAGIVLTPPTPVEPRAGVIGGEVAGEGTPSGLPSAVEEKQEEDEDGEEEEEEEELAPAQVLPPLELEWSLPDLGIGLGFGDDAEAPRSALVAPESFFSSLGLGGAGSLLEKEKEKVEGEGGAKVGKEELPFPVRRPFEEEEEDEDDEGESRFAPPGNQAHTNNSPFSTQTTRTIPLLSKPPLLRQPRSSPTSARSKYPLPWIAITPRG